MGVDHGEPHAQSAVQTEDITTHTNLFFHGITGTVAQFSIVTTAALKEPLTK